MTLSQADIDSLLGSQPADDVGSLLDKPSTGEDIATALQDPTFTPTVDQYKQFEEYNKTKQTDWLQTVLSAADSITQTAGQAAKAAVTTGAALNPKNYLEGLAQGTAQLYGLVAQSQNPDSPLFKLNNLISGTGSVESRYDQFIQARQFNKDLDAYAKGDMTIMFPPEQLNPEFVQGVAMVADPTMFLPGIGQALGVEKVGAKAVGKAAQIAGRGVQAVARPVEMAASAAERAITGITGVSPEALRGGLATSGVLAATGAAPAVGLIGAAPLAAAGAMDVGRAIEAAGTQLGRAPTRIGALEAVGAIPEANLRQRVIGTIGRYGGDAALNAALVGTIGSLEGAAIGGALGYLSGGEEGAAAGIGSGATAGALGSLGARGVQTLTGQQAKAARLNDLTTYIDTLPENKKAAYQTVQERFGTDTASNLMDLETAIRGTRSDIAVDLLTGDEFKKQAGVTARGIVPQENAPTPRILINVDAFSRGKGDTPIYTLGHELVHALASTKQFQGDITALTERLTGAYIPNPDGTMRLTAEGEYTPAKVEELFNQYVNKLPDEVKAKAITDNPTAADRAAYVGEELVAEQVGRILSAQKPDAFLRGFGTTRQSFTDMLILQDASRAASRIGQYFEKTFGVTPSDSILFPEIKQSSPILDASLRQLLKARENISEALQKAEFQKSFAINQNNISDPTVADFAVRGGFAVREPDGTVRLLTNGELLEREQRDVRQVKEIVDKLPGARFDIDGNLVGQLSKEQADALNASSVSSQMKERITAVNQAINEGRSVLNEYYPATEKKQDPQSKRWRTRYAGRRMTFRETLFYNLLFSKEGNAYARGIDLTKIRSSLQKHVRNGGVAGLWPDVGAFMGDLAAYLTNRERGENAIPTRQLLGPDKAEFMGSFLNNIEKGGSEFIHSFRLDRFGKMDAGDFRARFGETGYQGMKNRLMPAGTVGDAEAFKSQSGYTVLSKNNKFRLYGPDGALLGIYDSSQKAEKKIYATETRLQPEIDQQQRPARNEIGQTPEAGGRNRPVSRTQGSQEGGEVNQPVRQAGDVVGNFDALVASAPEVRFMPIESQPENAPVSGRLSDGQRASIDELSSYYAQKTPERVKVLRAEAVDSLASRLVNKGVPVQDANAIASKTFSKIRKGVSGALQVISGMGLSDLSRMAGTGKPTVERRPHINPNWLTSAFEAFATDEGLALMKAQQVATQLNKAEQAKVAAGESVEAAKASGVRQSTMQQGMEFVLGEINADRKAFGSSLREDLNSPPRVYASVLEGQKFGSQGNYNVFFEWKTQTPMVVTSHHHYGVSNGVTGIHAQGNVGDKNARSFGNPANERFDTLPSGKQVLDTHLLVGNEGVPDARAHQLTVSIPESALANIRKAYKERGVSGVDAELNKIAVSQMVGSASQGKTFSYTTKEGIPPMVAIQRNRTEAYVLDPDLSNVGAVTIVSNSPKEVALIKKNLQKAFENNGSQMPKVKVVSAESGASKNPGRKAITDEYFKLTGQPRFMPSDTDYLAAVQAGDTQAAQQMVDQAAKAAGYTIPVFHGTASEFNEFKPSRTGNFGPGVYVALDYQSALDYAKRLGGNRVIKGYAKVENPIIGSNANDAAEKLFSKFTGANDDQVVESAKRAGFDAVIASGTLKTPYGDSPPQISLLSTSQIKSADPITRDDSGNVIPLSQRFQTSSADIRYMPDYSGEHAAPRRDSGAPMDNLKGIYPDDIYGPNAARYYGHEAGSQNDKAAIRILQATKGKPDAPVKVFRAIPKQIKSDQINPGDWITTIKSYAVQHGESALGGDYKILEKTVSAGDLYTDGNSIFEFGYDPRYMPQPDPSIPGSYSVTGGFRILPGKTGGRLRVYGPSGELIGIAGGMDEAQRMIRRKTKSN